MSTRHTILTRGGARYEFTSSPSLVSSQHRLHPPRPLQRLIIWLVSIGMFLPYTFGETGKYVIALLFLPAIFVFMQGKRKVMLADILVWIAALWMIAVKVQSSALFATASDALSFVGAYMVARSFICSAPAIKEFVRALRLVAIVLIAVSVLDTLSGTFFTKDLMSKIFGQTERIRSEVVEIHRKLFGFTVLRATSTFPHPILYGTFCLVIATIFLYSERTIVRRAFYCGICVIGCLLSVSSAPLLGFVVAVSLYSYDRVLQSYQARWKIFVMVAMVIVSASFVVSENPLTWLLRNVTLDPADGYYRILIWQNALEYISHSPLMGADVSSWATNDILNDSIDSVWLVLSLEYGLPLVALLLLASLSACGVFGRKQNQRVIGYEIEQIRTAFSLVLFIFVLVGLAVHFWGSIWMLWGLCIGIRTSLEEYCSAGRVAADRVRNRSIF